MKRLGGWLAVAIVLIGLCADMLASDLPLLTRIDGRWFILPCITHPDALSGA